MAAGQQTAHQNLVKMIGWFQEAEKVRLAMATATVAAAAILHTGFHSDTEHKNLLFWPMFLDVSPSNAQVQ